MLRPAACRASRRIGLRSSSSVALRSLQPVQSVVCKLEDVDVDDFRRRAFAPERPFLVKSPRAGGSAEICAGGSSMPAAARWFTSDDQTPGEPGATRQRVVPSYEYLRPFQDTILPYELTGGSAGSSLPSDRDVDGGPDGLALSDFVGSVSPGSFHRFSAPLSLFLKACNTSYSSPSPQLYIAQAQIVDLPRELQDDLPTPTLVKAAGRGDIYDANIWIGLPPTYTPLHRDPNPNLFVQLASSKRVRLYEPSIGAAVFRDVRRSIGQSAQSSFRGEEMMEGPERDALHEAIWGHSTVAEGFEAVVDPGDALFIPKGWWHTIKSIGTDVTASVNWWFR